MSYAVIHMQKFKAPDVKGMQIHNQRLKQSETNFDIDHDKTKLNYDVLHSSQIDYKKAIDAEIEKRYTGNQAVRKDAVRLCGFMVTSDKAFFDALSEDEQDRFFKESVEFLQERYGKENIVYAQVHRDETTPHMHVGMVPITQEGKLSAKAFFGKKQELQSLQTDFHQHVLHKGFALERGEKGSDREHMDMQKFKAETLKENINSLESQLKATQAFEENLQTLASQNEEKRSISSKMGFKGKESVVMPKDNYEKLYALAAKGVDAEKQAEENKRLKEAEAENKKLYSLSVQADQTVTKMEIEIELMRKEQELFNKAMTNVKERFDENKELFSQIVGRAKAEAAYDLDLDVTKKKHYDIHDEGEVKGVQDFIKENDLSKKNEKTK